MCLAKVYVSAAAGDAGAELLMENVARIVVDGDRVRLSSILGETEELPGRITTIDFVAGKVALESLEV